MTHEIVKQLEQEFQFYRVSPELAADLYTCYLQKSNDPILQEAPSPDAQQLLQFGQIMAKKLYRTLAAMAREVALHLAEEGSVRQTLIEQLPVLLGLARPGKDPAADPPEVTALVQQLIQEFVDWLETQKDGTCITGWGQIHLRADGDLSLEYRLPLRGKRALPATERALAA